MRCDELTNLLPLLAVEALEPQRRARAMSHVAHCPTCSAELQAMRSAIARLEAELAGDDPQGSLTALRPERLRALADRTRAKQASSRPFVPWRSFSGLFTTGLHPIASLAAVLAVAAALTALILPSLGTARRVANRMAHRPQLETGFDAQALSPSAEPSNVPSPGQTHAWADGSTADEKGHPGMGRDGPSEVVGRWEAGYRKSPAKAEQPADGSKIAKEKELHVDGFELQSFGKASRSAGAGEPTSVGGETPRGGATSGGGIEGEFTGRIDAPADVAGSIDERASAVGGQLALKDGLKGSGGKFLGDGERLDEHGASPARPSSPPGWGPVAPPALRPPAPITTSSIPPAAALPPPAPATATATAPPPPPLVVNEGRLAARGEYRGSAGPLRFDDLSRSSRKPDAPAPDPGFSTFGGDDSQPVMVPEESVPEPIPRMQKLESLAQARQPFQRDIDPDSLLHEAKNLLQRGDIDAARQTLDQLRERVGTPAPSGSTITEANESAERLKTADSAPDRPREIDVHLARQARVLEQQLDLADRVLPQRPLQEAAQAMKLGIPQFTDADSWALEHRESGLRPGDKIAIAIVDNGSAGAGSGPAGAPHADGQDPHDRTDRDSVRDSEQAWSMQVDRSGRVRVPGLPGDGWIDASGLTPSQLQNAIHERLLAARGARDSDLASHGADPSNGVKGPLVAVIATGRIEQALKQTEEEERRSGQSADQTAASPDVQQQQGPPQSAQQPSGDDDAALDATTFRNLPVNPWVLTQRDRLSTFALDVDTASYDLARRFILGRQTLPPPGSVRMEEFVNRFDYNYPTSEDAPRPADDPAADDTASADPAFRVYADAAPAPFPTSIGPDGTPTVLLKIGVRGKTIGRDARKPAHLVFLIDTSGSMARPDRLPVVIHGLRTLIDHLGPSDRVSIVGFDSQARIVRQAVPAAQRDDLLRAVDSLRCQGSTNLAGGLDVAYRLAAQSYQPGQTNRVVLLSDGVANLGATDADHVQGKVARYRTQGIALSSIGVGSGAYNDDMLETLANRGDGSYLYIDSRQRAEEVFRRQFQDSIEVIARDAKIQVDFDPVRVRRYRLIGYENREVADADFRNDAVDAGEVGSGQTATALYEIELESDPAVSRADLGTVYVRYQDPDSGSVRELAHRLGPDILRPRGARDDPRFHLAAAAAQFAEVLRRSEHVRSTDLAPVQNLLQEVCVQLPLDRQAAELRDLVARARSLPPVAP